MGRAHVYTAYVEHPSAPRGLPVGRVIDLVVGIVLLTLTLPLMAVLALAVRRSSHGPVLHRERALDHRGQSVQLLAFRTTLDGAGTDLHQRLRAVVGADVEPSLTPVGRFMCRTRTDRLPRLFNVVAGQSALFGRSQAR